MVFKILIMNSHAFHFFWNNRSFPECVHVWHTGRRRHVTRFHVIDRLFSYDDRQLSFMRVRVCLSCFRKEGRKEDKRVNAVKTFSPCSTGRKYLLLLFAGLYLNFLNYNIQKTVLQKCSVAFIFLFSALAFSQKVGVINSWKCFFLLMWTGRHQPSLWKQKPAKQHLTRARS